MESHESHSYPFKVYIHADQDLTYTPPKLIVIFTVHAKILF